MVERRALLLATKYCSATKKGIPSGVPFLCVKYKCALETLRCQGLLFVSICAWGYSVFRAEGFCKITAIVKPTRKSDFRYGLFGVQ